LTDHKANIARWGRLSSGWWVGKWHIERRGVTFIAVNEILGLTAAGASREQVLEDIVETMEAAVISPEDAIYWRDAALEVSRLANDEVKRPGDKTGQRAFETLLHIRDFLDRRLDPSTAEAPSRGQLEARVTVLEEAIGNLFHLSREGRLTVEGPVYPTPWPEKSPCEHVWDGPRIPILNTATVGSCSKCGASGAPEITEGLETSVPGEKQERTGTEVTGAPQTKGEE